MTAGGREFQVAGAAQLKDRFPISSDNNARFLWPFAMRFVTIVRKLVLKTSSQKVLVF